MTRQSDIREALVANRIALKACDAEKKKLLDARKRLWERGRKADLIDTEMAKDSGVAHPRLVQVLGPNVNKVRKTSL